MSSYEVCPIDLKQCIATSRGLRIGLDAVGPFVAAILYHWHLYPVFIAVALGSLVGLDTMCPFITGTSYNNKNFME